ncbi:hypothetical protein V9P72_000265 [Yersinia enterocolitica]|nr:hypothetical protein [Yersinia enterocolitica]EKN6075348.1 hypothetical protein [Yersinia enterocolitica]HDL6700917.1 hypothetical protein [Yersinia enterocolitica]
MIELLTVVELYRNANRPDFNGRSFSATVNYEDVKKNVMILHSKNHSYGSFEEIEIDDVLYDNDESLPDVGAKISFTYITPSNNSERFYSRIEDLLKINTLKKGVFPERFYLISHNFYAQENNEPDEIRSLKTICNLIKSLSKIAHYHDTKNDSQNYRLVFIKNSDAKSTSAIIETDIDSQMLSNEPLNLAHLHYLIDENHKNEVHHSEKQGIFRNTIVEYASEHDFSFYFLVTKWNEFLNLYKNNLDVYLSGFAFHKARNEVAKAESEMAEKLSKIIGDITLKILSIPISLIAALGMLKLTGAIELIISFIGLTITSILVMLMITNQEKQFIRICHSKELIFKPIQLKIDTYPEDLAKEVKIVIKAFDDNQVETQNTLCIFKVLTWLPSVLALIILIVKITNKFYN